MSRRGVAIQEQVVRLIVGAGQATPSPPVGPALGSKGVKSMDFCKEFNALTNHIVPGTPIPSLITIRPDRSFHFILRTPPTSTLLLRAAGVQPSKASKLRGANAPGRTPTKILPSVNAAAVQGSPGEGVDRAPTQAAHSYAQAAQTAPSTTRSGKSKLPTAGGGPGDGVAIAVAKSAGGDKESGHGGGNTQVGEVSLKHVYEIARIKKTEERLSGLSLEGLCRSVVAQARSVGVGVVP